MRALHIAWKDIRQTYRVPSFLVLSVLAPVLLAFVLGSAFGSGDSFSISAVKTVVVNQDESATISPSAGDTILSALTSDEVADLVAVTTATSPSEAKDLVDQGDAAVAVIIPAGTTDAVTSRSSASPDSASIPLRLEIYRDPTVNVGPHIVATIVDSVVQSLNGARAAGAAAYVLATSTGVTDNDELNAVAVDAGTDFTIAVRQKPPIAEETRSPRLAGVEETKEPNIASQVLVGMMLFFMLFGASIPARRILDEHRQGTLPRLFTTPAPRSLILAGKYIGVFVVVVVQLIVLVVAGRFLLGADWGGPGPVAVLIIVSSLLAASLGLFTVSFAKTPAQAGAVSSAIFVFLALISGNFTGGVTVSGVYGTVKRVSPLGWLMEGWGDLLYGGSWHGIALPVLVSLGFTLAFFGVATFFFRRRYA